ncbi:trimeric intracellular cation channel family protein [Pseudaeromonas paramecii]|uniref:Trimeric intracellular cation channel family protein n=1 Tax=Pseudaeromonas paramecii TaxID=2138166 RepID=A0ABP8QIH3_9GAMM
MNNLIEHLIYGLDLFGTAIFALSGVLMAGRLRMDAIGVIVLAAVTAIGGGTIRDLLIGARPFWIQNTTYLWVILGTAGLGMLLTRLPKRLPWYTLPLADALGLALFVVIGAQKALSFGTSNMVAVVMGVITGVAGGMIRDMLAREVPLVLQKEIYATACIVGGILYTGSLELGLGALPAMLISMVGLLALRITAIFRHLSLPTFSL